MATNAIRKLWSRITALGCVVCGSPAECAHCIGKPSVTERVQEPKPKGKKLPRHDHLVIGACPWHHRWAPDSLDLNPTAFEANYGSVAGHIDTLCAVLEIDLWALSQKGRK